MFEERPSFDKSSRRKVYNLGVNDADYVIRYRDEGGKFVTCPFYMTWMRILKKVSKSQVTICDEWLSFSCFKKWMEGQRYKGHVLDRELKVLGSTHYSPANCLFLTPVIKALLVRKKKNNGQAEGVHWKERDKVFVSQISRKGRRCYLGNYATEAEASDVYREAKATYLKKVAEKEPEEVKHLLRVYAETIYE